MLFVTVCNDGRKTEICETEFKVNSFKVTCVALRVHYSVIQINGFSSRNI